MKGLPSRPGVVAMVLCLVALVAVPVRVALESRAELTAAKAAVASGDYDRATDHFRRTLRWWLPGLRTRDEAVSGLEGIARAREAAGDREAALLAWRSILGGISSTRTLFTSQSRTAERAKNEIARLAVREDDAGRHRAVLDRRVAPDPLGGTCLLLGFLVWVASLVLLTRRGFDHLGRLRLAAARGPLIGTLAGFASFVIGLLLA